MDVGSLFVDQTNLKLRQMASASLEMNSVAIMDAMGWLIETDVMTNI